ncbi:MAG TPA: kelch repeat-containing protein [Candidatus Binataceae bacterium]
MVGSTVEAVNVNPANGTNSGSPIGTATTNASGGYTITIAPPPTGPVRIEVAGGTFVSEQDGTTITTPTPLTVLLPSLPAGTVSVDLNPLTLFIDLVTIADIGQGMPFSTALNTATAKVEAIYGLVSNPNTLTPNYTASGVGTDAGNLGLILGALINEDQLLCPSAPGGLALSLATDLTDGVFDGKAFGAPVSYCGSGTLSAIAGTSSFQDALAGLYGLQLTTRGFVFGGPNNVLTLNGVTPLQTSTGVANINSSIIKATTVTNTIAAGPTLGTGQDRAGATATLLQNGMVLVAGGSSTSSGIRADAVLYNPASNTFSTLTSHLSTSREFATATLLPNGKVLIAGGLDGPGDSPVTQTTDIFDPTTDTFIQGPTMSSAREHAAAVALSNGTVLIAGGDSGSGANALSSTDIYNPSTNTFSSGPAMNHARTQLMATTLYTGDALFAGGESDGTSDNTAEAYSLKNNTFSNPIAMANGGREDGTATLLPSGNVLIAGGFTVTPDSSPQSLKSTELFLAVSNVFQSPRAVSMNAARDDMTATLTPSDTVLIAGGDQATAAASLSSTELYFANSDTFAPVANTVSLSVGRVSATATLLQNGQVLIAGGFNGTSTSASSGTTNTTDLYTP